ncbi:hypothetical protein [Deferrisoma palaeochoriense]
MRLAVGWGPLEVQGGGGIGAGRVAERWAGLWARGVGLGLGPLRVSREVQALEGGREVELTHISWTFPLGDPEATPLLGDPWRVGVFTRWSRHPGRAVDTYHQTGISLSRFFGDPGQPRRLVLEVEVSEAPVESTRRRPLRDGVDHNFRTQDEVFWGVYSGERRRWGPTALDFRAGVEAFYEDDDRVNAGRETGWFVGAAGKLTAWYRSPGGTAYGAGIAVGVDPLGVRWGPHLAVEADL